MLRFSQCALYVSSGNSTTDQTVSGSVLQIPRGQNTTVKLNFDRAEQSYLNDKIDLVRVVPPTVDLSFEYLATNGQSERLIGLITDGFNSAFWGLNTEKNYYIQVEDESVDANLSNSSTKKVLGFGNATLNGYSLAANVGGFVRTTCTLQANNLQLYTGNSGQIAPNVNYTNASNYGNLFTLPQASQQITQYDSNPANNIIAIGARDLIMEFPSGSVFGTAIQGTNACCLQNFSLAFSINRAADKRLGEDYARERRVVYPIRVQLSADAYLQQYQLAGLNDLSCLDSGHDINIILKQSCSDLIALEFKLRGMKLESQQINNEINDTQTKVNFVWNGLIGDLRDSGNNLFINANGGTEYWILSSTEIISGVDIYGDFYMNQIDRYERKIVENQFFTGMYYV